MKKLAYIGRVATETKGKGKVNYIGNPDSPGQTPFACTCSVTGQTLCISVTSTVGSEHCHS